MFESVATLLAELEEIQTQLSDPDVFADAARAKKLNRRYAELNKISTAYGNWQQAGEDLNAARELAREDEAFAEEVPVLDQLRGYLLKIRDQVLPKSEAGQAVSYALKNWAALTRYLEDGDLSIDNNHTERSLRGIAVGRNNWTFVGSDRGGRTMAVLRSFVASCELANVDPFAWFQDVLSRIGAHSIQQLDELLPHRWAAARL